MTKMLDIKNDKASLNKYASVKMLEEGIWLMTTHAKTMSLSLCRAIMSCLDEVDATEGPCCLITTGGHEKIYSAGLDFGTFTYHPEDVQNFLIEYSRCCARFMSLGYPTIAAINGHCFAAGCMVSHVQDFRIMRPDAGVWCVSEINYGLNITPGMTSILKAKLDSPTYLKAAT
jgi:enoyl-CoA hydratase/carnithine racemase